MSGFNDNFSEAAARSLDSDQFDLYSNWRQSLQQQQQQQQQQLLHHASPVVHNMAAASSVCAAARNDARLRRSFSALDAPEVGAGWPVHLSTAAPVAFSAAASQNSQNSLPGAFTMAQLPSSLAPAEPHGSSSYRCLASPPHPGLTSTADLTDLYRCLPPPPLPPSFSPAVAQHPAQPPPPHAMSHASYSGLDQQRQTYCPQIAAAGRLFVDESLTSCAVTDPLAATYVSPPIVHDQVALADSSSAQTSNSCFGTTSWLNLTDTDAPSSATVETNGATSAVVGDSPSFLRSLLVEAPALTDLPLSSLRASHRSDSAAQLAQCERRAPSADHVACEADNNSTATQPTAIDTARDAPQCVGEVDSTAAASCARETSSNKNSIIVAETGTPSVCRPSYSSILSRCPTASGVVSVKPVVPAPVSAVVAGASPQINGSSSRRRQQTRRRKSTLSTPVCDSPVVKCGDAAEVVSGVAAGQEAGVAADHTDRSGSLQTISLATTSTSSAAQDHASSASAAVTNKPTKKSTRKTKTKPGGALYAAETLNNDPERAVPAQPRPPITINNNLGTTPTSSSQQPPLPPATNSSLSTVTADSTVCKTGSSHRSARAVTAAAGGDGGGQTARQTTGPDSAVAASGRVAGTVAGARKRDVNVGRQKNCSSSSAGAAHKSIVTDSCIKPDNQTLSQCRTPSSSHASAPSTTNNFSHTSLSSTGQHDKLSSYRSRCMRGASSAAGTGGVWPRLVAATTRATTLVVSHTLPSCRLAVQLLLWLVQLVSDVLLMSSRLVAALLHQLVIYLCHQTHQLCVCIVEWTYCACGWLYSRVSSSSSSRSTSSSSGATHLAANISVPSTGEEAMKRLLACRGHDPYSVLGVTSDCSDAELRRLYRRQALLVHPDKSRTPGAEEAFKILQRAFDMVGEPERRAAFDAQLAKNEAHAAYRQYTSEMMTRLREKIEESQNTIRCNNCNGRHRRYKTTRPCYAARLCSSCRICHAAREGDIWAERVWWRLWWRYYACMDGAVYDVSAWARCQSAHLYQLRANSHAVQYRIVSGVKNHHHNHHNHRNKETAAGAEEDGLTADLDDLMDSFGSGGGGGASRHSARASHSHAAGGRRHKTSRRHHRPH